MFGKRRAGKTLQFLPSGRRAPFDGPKSVLDVALANGIALAHSCGGMGSCGTCLIQVEGDASAAPAREGLEAEMALDRGFRPCERLACQLIAFDGLKVRTPEAEPEA